jgi:mono/diheme cytochrome c family protein
MKLLLLPCMTALALLAGLPLFAAAPVDYVREVKPVLAERCSACHGALQQKGDLRVDTAQMLREGGSSGPAVVPGRPEESLLLAHVTASQGKRRMPPPSEGERLSDAQIDLLRAWIQQGAHAPADEKPEPDPRTHWAFRAPSRPAVPKGGERPSRNPIDAFLGEARDRHGLRPQPAADWHILLRRVYLDLIGLPPSREELAAFVADTSADAFEKVVDRLLASPQYGERWGRHWMDVWRYSDWWGLGAEVRNSQKHMWHWRDWIVESLNADKGYDQMVREMLAADELYPNDLDRLRATGFLARQYFIFNRNSWMEETIEHTAKAFLGLTMNCARCHDHKFDPISQTDYYRFRAFFEPYQVRTDEVPGEADVTKDGLPRVFDCNLDAPTYRFLRGDDRHPLKDRPLTPGLPRLLAFRQLDIRPVALPAEAHSPGLRPFVLDSHLRQAESKIQAAQAALDQARNALARAEKVPAAPAVAARPPARDIPAGKVLFRDDFASPRPQLWKVGAGKWEHTGRGLRQQIPTEMRSFLQARRRPPQDFQARCRFTIRGGEPWRSVGLSFDVAGSNDVLVYVSAVAGGPKVQIAYKQGADYIYPPEAAQSREIKLNEPLELTVRVRGPLLNVAVGGKHALAYRLPLPRQAGDLQLITFAAQAEFTAFELTTLPATVELIDAGSGAAAEQTTLPTLDQAWARVVLAEKTLAAARLEPEVSRACVAADRAALESPAAPQARTLARLAALGERRLAAARAEEALAQSELELLRANDVKKAEAMKKRDAARAALAAARKAVKAPGETYTPLRGAVKTPESNVESEASRNKPFPRTSSGRRSALAQWMTDRRHPLTARVAVNHVWARHFDRPLVANVFDFGRRGTPPTHPELLDWLAVELMDSGWSLKHLHRLMVTSEAYRLNSSGAGATANRKIDPENRYYWRMNPVRMDAPILRDSLLVLAGVLDPAMGGPSIPTTEEVARRRSIYFVHSHNDHHRFLSMFDDASVLECYRRQESILPQQALTLSNSRFSLDMAVRINTRLHERLGTVADREFVRAAFKTILACLPTAEEEAECERMLAQLTRGLQRQNRPDAQRRARGQLIQALLNHNDFITIR